MVERRPGTMVTLGTEAPPHETRQCPHSAPCALSRAPPPQWVTIYRPRRGDNLGMCVYREGGGRTGVPLYIVHFTVPGEGPY